MYSDWPQPIPKVRVTDCRRPTVTSAWVASQKKQLEKPLSGLFRPIDDVNPGANRKLKSSAIEYRWHWSLGNERFLVHATLSQSRWPDSPRVEVSGTVKFWTRRPGIFQPKTAVSTSQQDQVAITYPRSVGNQQSYRGEGYDVHNGQQRGTPLHQDYAFSVHHVSHNEYRSTHPACFPDGRAMRIA